MFKRFWLKLPIEAKVKKFAISVFLVIIVASALSIMALQFAVGEFGAILNDNRSCQEFLSAINRETESFRSFINEQSEENREQLLNAVTYTEQSLRALPSDYSRIGEERYAQIWNIWNAYENYEKTRDLVISTIEQNKVTEVDRLYSVYDMQEYLAGYSRRLLQMTVEDGTASYNKKLPFYEKVPFLLLNTALLLGLLIFYMSRLMAKSIVDPVMQLSSEAKKISENDFSPCDLSVPNEDELGELVGTFNVMKHSTENYINTLKENHQMTELLQKKQMENMDIEKRLDQTRMELLKSQINPHFLFNTLNMISSMANVENACSTEKMINSLSALFRYNLSTLEQTVPLRKELEISENYMFLQKMRFGSRIRYHVSVPEDTESIIVPSFMLQPLLENAVRHGLSRKEKGGDIWLRVIRKDGQVRIFVTDTGLGIREEKLQEMRKIIRTGRTSSLGIGLGNICQRVLRLYEHSSVELYSKEGRGTAVVIRLPESGPIEAEHVKISADENKTGEPAEQDSRTDSRSDSKTDGKTEGRSDS